MSVERACGLYKCNISRITKIERGMRLFDLQFRVTFEQPTAEQVIKCICPNGDVATKERIHAVVNENKLDAKSFDIGFDNVYYQYGYMDDRPFAPAVAVDTDTDKDVIHEPDSIAKLASVGMSAPPRISKSDLNTQPGHYSEAYAKHIRIEDPVIAEKAIDAWINRYTKPILTYVNARNLVFRQLGVTSRLCAELYKIANEIRDAEQQAVETKALQEFIIGTVATHTGTIETKTDTIDSITLIGLLSQVLSLFWQIVDRQWNWKTGGPSLAFLAVCITWICWRRGWIRKYCYARSCKKRYTTQVNDNAHHV